MMYSASLLATLVAALAATSPATASKHDKAPPAPAAELQLETARAPQGMQRAEFPLTGDESAFKFNFAADVRLPLPRLRIACSNQANRLHLVSASPRVDLHI